MRQQGVVNKHYKATLSGVEMIAEFLCEQIHGIVERDEQCNIKTVYRITDNCADEKDN